MDGHGTHVIDIIQTVAPEAQFMAFKACYTFGCPDDAIIASVNRAMDLDRNLTMRKVDILNLSLGATGGSLSDAAAEAVESAARQGIAVVASAGNSGPVVHALGSPAVAPRATAVAEMETPARKREGGHPANLAIVEFSSSSGPGLEGFTIKPEVGAVGRVITAHAGTGDLNSTFSGTSGAAPVIAGMYALLKQRFPALTPHQLRARLVNTARTGAVWGGDAQSDTVQFIGRRPGELEQLVPPAIDWALPAFSVLPTTASNLWVYPPFSPDFSSWDWAMLTRPPFKISARTPVPVMRLGSGEAQAVKAMMLPTFFYAQDDSRDPKVPRFSSDTTGTFPAGANFGRVGVGRLTVLAPKTL